MNTSFSALELSEPTLKALDAMGFTEPTPIQSRTIPLVMEGRDVIAKAPTGTGKTCAFGIPLIECLNPDMKDLQAVVLCPTRELCEQITGDLRALIRFNPAIRIASIYGGQSMKRQVDALKKHPHIVVATPGRLLDHMGRGNVWLGNLYTAVLDEADEMLKMGFIKDVRRILNATPQDTQVVMFSATISREVMDVAWEYQHDAVEIQVASEGDNRPDIHQYLIHSTGSQRLEDMLDIIRQEEYHRVMVFANMKVSVKQLTERLQKRHGSVDCLHGDMPQSLRNKVMAAFRENKLEILVATDVAARGIDVEDVEAVFNYDIPDENEYYLHRIGRTGRAKRQGAAYTFMSDADRFRIRDILKYTRSEAVTMTFDENRRLIPAVTEEPEE
ncbi:MAG: DEAD/DEAH box helicase [Ruminococcaceae bacterium]|nr:DEAD/DEAH box helicase [Oscillospiraceae bacterium]